MLLKKILALFLTHCFNPFNPTVHIQSVILICNRRIGAVYSKAARVKMHV